MRAGQELLEEKQTRCQMEVRFFNLDKFFKKLKVKDSIFNHKSK